MEPQTSSVGCEGVGVGVGVGCECPVWMRVSGMGVGALFEDKHPHSHPL